jgi:hypothetical protein
MNTKLPYRRLPALIRPRRLQKTGEREVKGRVTGPWGIPKAARLLVSLLLTFNPSSSVET